MPAWVAMTISTRPRSPASASVFRSPSSTALNGCLSFHSGCSGAIALTRSSAKASWMYIGCSVHSVPSLSKMAMRSGPARNRRALARDGGDEIEDRLLRRAVVPRWQRIRWPARARSRWRRPTIEPARAGGSVSAQLTYRSPPARRPIGRVAQLSRMHAHAHVAMARVATGDARQVAATILHLAAAHTRRLSESRTIRHPAAPRHGDIARCG